MSRIRTDKDRERGRRNKERLRAGGLCLHCGNQKAATGKVLCRFCLDKSRQRTNDRHDRFRAEGRCQSCGGTLDLPEIRAYCSVCREKQLARNHLRDKAAFAAYHKDWRQRNPHAFKAAQMRRHGRKRGAPGSFSRQQLDGRIQYYGGLCYVCGRPYEDIDHVVPVSRGGSNWPANLRPICKDCNRRKGMKPLAEFLASAAPLRFAHLTNSQD